MMRRAATTVLCAHCRCAPMITRQSLRLTLLKATATMPTIFSSQPDLFSIHLWPRARHMSTTTEDGSKASSSSTSPSETSTKEAPPHFKLILPDMGQASKTGSVVAWRKEEGDFIKSGDVICEVEMDQFTVGMEIQDKGFLARILVSADTKNVPAGEALAILVYDDNHIHDFASVPTYSPTVHESSSSASEPPPAPPVVDGVTILKFVHNLVKSGQIKDAEFGKQLQALARQENPALLRVYQASFEGEVGDDADFDVEFFLENARGIVEEEEKSKEGA